MRFECLKNVLSRIKTLIMNLNQDRTLNDINSFRLDEKYTDTVLEFSDGHIYVCALDDTRGPWFNSIWWTLARDTNCDNIVEVILPEISLAEGLVFVEEVYSSINYLKALNQNRDFTDQNSVLLRDNNINNSYDDIENDPDMELTIRGSEDKDSRLTETEPQTISIAEEDIIEDENFQTIVINGLIT